MLSLYEILRASKTGIAPDMWTALAGMNWGGADSGHEVKELTGIPPLSIRSNGTILLDCLISGNTVQNGTPSPNNPIIPNGTGERTGNLFDISTVEKGRIDNGEVGYVSQTSSLTIEGGTISFTTTTAYRGVCSGFIEIPEGTETITFDFIRNKDLGVKFVFYDSAKTWLNQDYSPILTDIPPATTNIPSGAKYVRLSFTGQISGGYSYTMSNLMLNTGSTALPYEPYGIKIPISSGGENLFDKDNYNTVYGYFIAEGTTTIMGESNNNIVYIPCKPNTTYTVSKILSNRFGIGYTIDKPAAGVIVYGAVIGYTATSLTVTTDSSAKYIVAYVRNGNAAGTLTLSEIVNSLQITEGSEPLPYEPYIEPTETNIYLGEAETTRKIKKLVLTGNERWNESSKYIGSFYAYLFNLIPDAEPSSQIVCTHVDCQPEVYQYGYGRIDYNSLSLWLFDSGVTLSAFKSYLAQQYANGTPVTVWYVLATPETGIVNEPLMKIGAYADSISMEQAQVSIPTLHGNTVIDVLTDVKPSEMYIKYQE